jgi:hypothetical protein
MQTPDESKEIEEVIDRLMKKFPTATREEVVAAVSKEHQALVGHRVRDFVPVLVEKQAKNRLKTAHARQD